MKLGRPLLLAASVLLVACGGSSSRASGDDDAGAPATGGGSGDGGGSNGGGFNGTTGDDAGSALQGKAVVYGHSDDTLFELDPDTKAVTAVGTFSGCTKVVDLALDKASNMFATTQTGLAKIDPATAKCSYIAKGTYPNSLSFVPAGTVDPNVEALVGYVLGDYVRIDTQSGAITTIGSLGGNLVSSGDIVSAIGGKTYLTVKGGSCSDCIVEVDPATGALVKNFGNVKHKDVFGLAFWAGKAYGFDNAGELFEMDFTASGVTTTPIAIPNASSSLSFWGAGSTTAAPLGPK